MERNTKTTIEHLAIGDRFYLQNDKNRMVRQKVEKAPFKTKHYTYTNWAKADNQKHPDKMRHDTAVVFLRSSNDGQ